MRKLITISVLVAVTALAVVFAPTIATLTARTLAPAALIFID